MYAENYINVENAFTVSIQVEMLESEMALHTFAVINGVHNHMT